ncbi:MAG: hypothetical protein ABFD97_00405 [Syntrophobacter sp.]
MNKVYFDEVGDIKLDRVTKLLAGIPDGVYRAVGSAIKRAASHGLTVGMRIVSEEYAISQGDLKERTRNINTIEKTGPGSYEVTFGYRGNVIPLIRFDTKINKEGRVSARVLRTNARTAIENAFTASVNGHTGIFEREGPSRLPIKELFGPSAVQAFYAHEETVDKMDAEVRNTYESRIEHEITRVLNGWGGKS